MKKSKIFALAILATSLGASLTSCGSSDGGKTNFVWDETYVGNYTYKDASGKTTDADGAMWDLRLDEIKFYLTGHKLYEDANMSIAFAEGPLQATLDGNIVQLKFFVANGNMFYQNWSFKVRRDGLDGDAETKYKTNFETKFAEWQSSAGEDAYIELKLEVTSNDKTNRGTFYVETPNVTLGFDGWDLE
mgnify:CR=1 FL=1